MGSESLGFYLLLMPILSAVSYSVRAALTHHGNGAG